MDKKISVGIVGVTGYTGMELVRLVSQHPCFALNTITSRQAKDLFLQELFPQFHGHPEGNIRICDLDLESIVRECDLVFLAVPHGTAMDLAASFFSNGLKVVDLSADFRLRSAATYEQWYSVSHKYQELLPRAVYGLIELNKEAIEQASLIANPGCYPTSAILGLCPALAKGVIFPHSLVIDSKSGTSGAGRSLKSNSLFCEVYDNFKPYSLGSHRHTPEIEQELGLIAGQEITISFNPHLVPINRGIVSTMYTHLQGETTVDDIYSLYCDFYKSCPWIRILPPGNLPQARWVRGTMFCDIGLVVDRRNQRLIVASVIDNLCRGASGQAIANANLMCGLDMTTGLEIPSLVP
jgi:N-acetyl-gamma-glutamyl-phosphate reductase